jgi:MFS transporter, MHS family, proline/betaine transporter
VTAAAAPRPLPRASLGIAAMSTIVEWYDFTLYLYFATVLARVFYGGGAGSLAATLGGFALSYLMRPLGALAFGHLGDRHGRRPAMLVSMALMTAAMLGIALLPTGTAGGWLLLALRCVMAFSVGGEYTGVVAYLMEGARAERRGLVTSCASAASEVGGLLAVAVSAVTVASLDAAALQAWGWRVPFLVGAALAGAILLARATIAESPEFERQAAAGSVPPSPLGHALRHHRRGIARGFAISALGSITYYVGITYVPAFLVGAGRLAEGAALALSTVAAVAVIAVTPLVGIASDRVGRRPVLVALAASAAVLPLAAFPLMARGSEALALAGALILALLGGAVSAVGAVATAEQFPGEGRLTGLALGATAATVLFGGLAPLVAELLVVRSGAAVAPGLMIAAVGLGVLPVLWRLPETAPAQRPPKRKLADTP